MKNIGIIAEYNPFHNGHLYHLQSTKEETQANCLVVVMSGNFTQRGEPAILDKWARAQMAIKGGADLVIELPFVFACNNAEFFAYGGIKLLNELNIISHISFGSESGSIEELSNLALFLSEETGDFKVSIKEHLSLGLSYPRARYEAVKGILGAKTAKLLKEPNNILAIEYLKQLIRQKSSIKPMTVTRKGESHFKSATNIRNAIAQGKGLKKFIPSSTLEVMEGADHAPITDSEMLFSLIMYKIITSAPLELEKILSSGEGLEHKLKKSIRASKSYEELVKAMLSKRYTETRIRRLLIHTLIGLTKKDFFKMKDDLGLYARVLGFSENGASLLRYAKKNSLSRIPILTNINKELDKKSPLKRMLEYDIVAADIYNFCYRGDMYSKSDYVIKPFGVDLI